VIGMIQYIELMHQAKMEIAELEAELNKAHGEWQAMQADLEAEKVRHAKTRAKLAAVRIREGDAAWVVLVERHARTLANLGAMQADRDYLLARVRDLEAVAEE
jgi:Skp family chaperone for outer membrane proteins